MFIQRFVPFPAVGTKPFLSILKLNSLVLILLASANVCNVLLMRNQELTDGIEVENKNGEIIGTSVVAARKVSIH